MEGLIPMLTGLIPVLTESILKVSLHECMFLCVWQENFLSKKKKKCYTVVSVNPSACCLFRVCRDH